MREKNSIELELEKLDEQWENFLETSKPFFCWQLKSDEIQLANTYIRVKERLDYNSEDLFIGLRTDFNSAETHGSLLTQEINRLLIDGFEAAIQEEREQDLTPINNVVWQPFEPAATSNSFQQLIDISISILNQFDQAIENLALAIIPTQINDIDEWHRWWSSCSELHQNSNLWPERLKLVVFEQVTTPFIAELQHHFEEQWVVEPAVTNMRAAIATILDKTDDGSDGAKLRKLINQMNYALGDQDLESLQKYSQQALQIALGGDYFDMGATVLMIRAAGYLNNADYDQAASDYQQAQNYAQQGIAVNTPGCEKLLIQAGLCEGSAWFGASRFSDAAEAYRRAAAWSEQYEDAFFLLESWRMAAFCAEKNKDSAEAWQTNLRALDVAKIMTPEEQQTSTLPFVGDALLRVAPDTAQRNMIEREVAQLLGEDWRIKLQEVAGSC